MQLLINPEKYPIPCKNGFALDRVVLTPGSVILLPEDAAIVQAHPAFEDLKALGAIAIVEEPASEPKATKK